jgi:hypothetical protein
VRRGLGVGLLAVALTLASAGCAEDDPGADGDVESLGDLVPAPVTDELTRSGRCDDGLLWAADEAGSVAVTIAPGPDGMPAGAVLPTEAVAVTVLHGEDLATTVCTDGGDVGSRSPGVEGRVEVERPTEECGPTSFRVDGLEAENGTTFGPIAGHDAAEGCVSG